MHPALLIVLLVIVAGSEMGCVTPGKGANQSSIGTKVGSDAFDLWLKWNTLAEKAIQQGKEGVPVIEKLLFADDSKKEIEASLNNGDEEQVEAVLLFLRSEVALVASRANSPAYDRLLLRYYYGEEQAGQALTSEEQLATSARRVVEVGPRTIKRLSDEKFADGSPKKIEYELRTIRIQKDKAEVDISVTFHGLSRVVFERRTINGVRTWIPTQHHVLTVY